MTLGSAAFDDQAADYDRLESENAIRRQMRARSIAILDQTFPTGASLLDIGCGTGTEAIWLAQRGRRVLAVDPSPEMLEVLTTRAAAAQVSVQARQLGADQLSTLEPATFDGAYSSFGALNAEPDLRVPIAALGRLLLPGGRIVLGVMNRWCVSEVFLMLARLRFKDAFRRFQRRLVVPVGASAIEVSYPDWPAMKKALSSDFRILKVEALLLLLVPYAWPALAHHGRILNALMRLDAWLAPHRPWAWLGDHLLVVAERR